MKPRLNIAAAKRSARKRTQRHNLSEVRLFNNLYNRLGGLNITNLNADSSETSSRENITFHQRQQQRTETHHVSSHRQAAQIIHHINIRVPEANVSSHKYAETNTLTDARSPSKCQARLHRLSSGAVIANHRLETSLEIKCDGRTRRLI